MSKYSVIVVDDENKIASYIAKSIERTNPAFHVVKTYNDGEDALNSLKLYMPHLLFTDINMPVMSGLELIEKAKSINPSLKCVIVSGYDDFEYAKSAIKQGVTDYLLKPINFEELEQILKEIEIQFLSDLKEIQLEKDDSYYTTEELVSLIKEFVKKNYHLTIDLSKLAEQLGFSSSYLTKIFVKYMDVTPSRYIRRYRISIAKQLLNNPDLTINEISSSVGYTDPFHFSKSFKNETGISPSLYRKKLLVAL